MHFKEFKRLLGKIQFPPTAKLVDVVTVMEAYQKTEVNNEKWKWKFCKSIFKRCN